MKREIRKLFRQVVKEQTPKKDLEKQMREIQKGFTGELDFEAIALTKGITIRELVNNFDEHYPELNNY